eukprot:6478730-Lingulodinium_polyedra.AAC.1
MGQRLAIEKPANGQQLASGWPSIGRCWAIDGPADGQRLASGKPAIGGSAARFWLRASAETERR